MFMDSILDDNEDDMGDRGFRISNDSVEECCFTGTFDMFFLPVQIVKTNQYAKSNSIIKEYKRENEKVFREKVYLKNKHNVDFADGCVNWDASQSYSSEENQMGERFSLDMSFEGQPLLMKISY